MIGKGLVKKLTAAFVVAGSAFVAVIAFGASVYYALALVLPPLGAAALTAGLFALVAVIVAVAFLGASGTRDDEDDEEDAPSGIAGRAYALFRQRPVLGTVAALAGGWIFLRNPALATMVAAAFTEKSHGRYRR
jgi:predicted permease